MGFCEFLQFRGGFLYWRTEAGAFLDVEYGFSFAFAYSGGVFSMTIKGEIDFVLAYSGGVFSKTFEGVSFRTGLRG